MKRKESRLICLVSAIVNDGEKGDIQPHTYIFRELVSEVDAIINEIPCPLDTQMVVHPVVKRAIVRRFGSNWSDVEAIFGKLHYDSLSKHYGFWFNNMYHGVEPDGHIHT